MEPSKFFEKRIGSLFFLAFFLVACNNGSSTTVKDSAQNDSLSRAMEKDAGNELDENTGLSLKLLASDIVSPVAMAAPGDGTGRLFICQQPGVIKIFRNGAMVDQPFLEIEDRVDKGSMFYSEKGLLGLAFHPDFKNNSKFYIYYSSQKDADGMDHVAVLSEWKVSADNPDRADPGSERIILEVGQPKSNHNGGQVEFGPDGYLYLGLGDGGGAGDEFGKIGNGQDLTTLLGSIIRIDVDGKTPYEIPNDNPFVGKDGRDEIYAYGLRNPWRFSFSPDGRLFCGDVGQNKWEEVDIITKGGNYGWRLMEGNHCFNPSSNCRKPDLIMPIHEYSHDVGISITGGYVYGGEEIPWLKGKYVFGDWRGPVFYLEEVNGEWKSEEVEFNPKPEYGSINSFGRDEAGEIYMLAQKNTGPDKSSGQLYKIVSGK